MKNNKFVDFKNFLVTEGVKTGTGTEYFSMKIGDLVTSLQKLSRDVAHMGSRTTTDILKDITNSIRVILNDKWDESIRPKLPKIQKIGVALAKLIDEGGEIPGTIASAQAELEQMISKLGNPLYSTGEDEIDEE
jgi:hypothetical protein